MSLLHQYGIENFYDTAIRQDFMRDFLFRVVSIGGARFAPDELIYMTTTSLPGKSIVVVNAPFMGLEFRVPGATTYNQSGSWPVTFRCPANLSVRRKLEDWVTSTFDDRTSTGNYDIPDKSVDNSVIATLLDKQGNPIRTYTLFGAFCTGTGDMAFNQAAGNGQIVEISATLAYQYWRISR